jgi:hypothetical protein
VAIDVQVLHQKPPGVFGQDVNVRGAAFSTVPRNVSCNEISFLTHFGKYDQFLEVRVTGEPGTSDSSGCQVDE